MARTEYGDYDWTPKKDYVWMLQDVTEVLYQYQDYWPLSQRGWLYRLMATKGWDKTWEASTPSTITKRGSAPNRTSGGGLQLILDRGRRSGKIPWEAVLSKRGTRETPYRLTGPDQFADTLEDVLEGMTVDRQMNQERRLVVCIEADGMVPILTNTCLTYGVELMSGQGFNTIGAKYDMAQAIGSWDTLILHLGDHDHSGREIERALRGDVGAWVADIGGNVEVKNIALTNDQIDEYGLHSEPAKRNKSNHGIGSNITRWAQLEAFDPPDLVEILKREIESNLDMNEYHHALMLEEHWKKNILLGLHGAID